MRLSLDNFPEDQREVVRMLYVVMDAHEAGRLPGLQRCSRDYRAHRVKVTIWPDDVAARETLAALLPPDAVEITVERHDARAY